MKGYYRDKPTRKLLITMMLAAMVASLGLMILMPSGRAVFMEQRCISCHRFKGEGGMTGPDLTGVRERRSFFWIMKQIKDPRSHNADSRMPAYIDMGYLEISAVIFYLGS